LIKIDIIYRKIITTKHGMIRTKFNTFYLVSTRFNKKTWRENESYRDKRNINGCIYGSSKRISPTIPQASILFVLEMLNIPKGRSNAPGKIMGIGLLRNYVSNKRRRIYNDHNYNTYTYTGKYRIDREDMTNKELEILYCLETMVFRGKGHLKRGQGLTRIPQKKIYNKKNTIMRFMKSVFLT